MSGAIRTTLVDAGRRIFDAAKGFVPFTGDEITDTLLNDLENYPHAFVIARIMDRIDERYSGNAANIWADTPSSADVVFRFLEFDGIGPKTATMATNILARDFKIPFSDYYSIDIAVDVHVRRVFERLGLVRTDACTEEIVYRARALSPDFLGLLDFPCWEIGRNWCRPSVTLCTLCYMQTHCPTAAAATNADGTVRQ